MCVFLRLTLTFIHSFIHMMNSIQDEEVKKKKMQQQK